MLELLFFNIKRKKKYFLLKQTLINIFFHLKYNVYLEIISYKSEENFEFCFNFRKSSHEHIQYFRNSI